MPLYLRDFSRALTTWIAAALLLTQALLSPWLMTQMAAQELRGVMLSATFDPSLQVCRAFAFAADKFASDSLERQAPRQVSAEGDSHSNSQQNHGQHCAACLLASTLSIAPTSAHPTLFPPANATTLRPFVATNDWRLNAYATPPVRGPPLLL